MSSFKRIGETQKCLRANGTTQSPKVKSKAPFGSGSSCTHKLATSKTSDQNADVHHFKREHNLKSRCLHTQARNHDADFTKSATCSRTFPKEKPKTWYETLRESDQTTHNSKDNSSSLRRHECRHGTNNKPVINVVATSVNDTQSSPQYLKQLVEKLHHSLSTTGDQSLINLVTEIKSKLETDLPRPNILNDYVRHVSPNSRKCFTDPRQKEFHCSSHYMHPDRDETPHGRTKRVSTRRVVSDDDDEYDDDVMNDPDIDPILKEKYFNLLRKIKEKKISYLEEMQKEKLEMDMLTDLNRSVKLLSKKTCKQNQSIYALQKLILKLHSENQMLNKMSEIRSNLENKLDSIILENKQLKKELSDMKMSNEKALKEKDREICSLRKYLESVKSTIASCLDTGSATCDKSLALSDWLNSLDQSHLKNCSLEGLIRPTSSSPNTSVEYTSHNGRGRNYTQHRNIKYSKCKQNGDYDSGIQSNTPEKSVMDAKIRSDSDVVSKLKNDLRAVFYGLREELRDDNARTEKDSICSELSLALSDNTFKYEFGEQSRSSKK